MLMDSIALLLNAFDYTETLIGILMKACNVGLDALEFELVPRCNFPDLT
jgi:hypothetical protein